MDLRAIITQTSAGRSDAIGLASRVFEFCLRWKFDCLVRSRASDLKIHICWLSMVSRVTTTSASVSWLVFAPAPSKRFARSLSCSAKEHLANSMVARQVASGAERAGDISRQRSGCSWGPRGSSSRRVHSPAREFAASLWPREPGRLETRPGSQPRVSHSVAVSPIKVRGSKSLSCARVRGGRDLDEIPSRVVAGARGRDLAGSNPLHL